MSRRSPLPPPPPPEHVRAWPDRRALLADRARAIGELRRRGLAVAPLLLLWAYGLVAALGWAFCSLGLGSFEERGAGYVTGVVELTLGLIFLVPAVIGIGFGVAKDRTVRGRLDAWAALGPDPENDHRLRAGARSAVWLGLSGVLCVIGFALAVTGVAQPSSPGVGETAYLVGTGVIALVIGALGVLRAVGHQRWAGRVLSPVPPREGDGGGGGHR
ncbi:hypothetical protein [Streptomyces sp. NBC_01506]|uniref:hypothetical protein n=1 Tax=Streptomyces sp. NBC_01506 TaxID=2903887 RepID=UPI00386CD94F